MFKLYYLVLLGSVIMATACTFSGQVASQLPTPEEEKGTPTTMPTSSPSATGFPSPIPSLTPTNTSVPTDVPSTPTLSPSLSSLRIAFTYDKQLWLWQNGVAQPLTGSEGYARVNISDDAKIIAFARDGGLWVINSDGSNEHVLVNANDFKSMEPTDPGVALNQFDWIPGTHWLLFNTFVLTDYGWSATNDLYFVDSDTRRWTRLRQPGEGGKFDVSPDGQHVAMTTPSQISLMKIEGSDYRVVLTYTVPYPSEVAYYAQPVWASDSKSLTVAIPPEDFFYGTTSPTNIWRVPTDGTAPEIVSQLPAGDSGDNARIWSPDKKYYAIQSGDKYYLGMDGADLEPLTESSSIFGWFSWIDETHFLYIGPCELRLGTIGASSILIADLRTTDDCISSYDFVK